MYSSELIGFLSTSHHSSLISTWEQLYEVLERREMSAASFSGSWFRAEADKLLTTAVVEEMLFMDSYKDLFRKMYYDGYVWIESSSELIPTLSRFGELPPGRKTYVMGIGAGFGATWDGFAFSRARPEVRRRFEPFIKKYYEYGITDHWGRTSMTELAVYAKQDTIDTDKSSGTTAEAHEGLTFKDFVGSFVAYTLFVILSLFALLWEHCTVVKTRPKRGGRRPTYRTVQVMDQLAHNQAKQRCQAENAKRQMTEERFYQTVVLSHYRREMCRSRRLTYRLTANEVNRSITSQSSSGSGSGSGISNISVYRQRNLRPGDAYRARLAVSVIKLSECQSST